MKIVRVETVSFGIPIKAFADANAQYDKTIAVLVKIYADDGTIGFGEACAWSPAFYGETLESVTSSIQNHVAPKIVGQNPFDIGLVMSIVDATLARSTCVKEGIDLALFDLIGKILNVPVYTLLNGRFRDRVPAACEIGIGETDMVIQDAEEILRTGVKIIKIKCSGKVNEDIQRVTAIQEAVGDRAIFRLDANAHWNTLETIRAMRALRDCNIQYLEQPIPSWNLDGMAKIRASIGVPLMADESVWTPQDVVELAKRDAADIVNIKISKTGGLSLAKRVEAVADAVGLSCVVGTELEPGISLPAKLHLAASLRNLPLACEYTELVHLKDSILRPKIVIEDGSVRVPEGAGFGVQIDEDLLSKYSLGRSK